MSDQIENAPVPGAMSVASAASAPPAASCTGCPPAAPEPMNEPTTASTALTATVSCRARSLPVVPVVSPDRADVVVMVLLPSSGGSRSGCLTSLGTRMPRRVEPSVE